MHILPQPLRLKQQARQLLDSLLPGSCLLCSADSRHLLCAACETDLPLLPETRCPQCGAPTTHGERCGACLHAPPHFDACQALFQYEFPADRLIQALKYGHQLAVADWLGEKLAALLAGNDADRIVPLPLHPQRLRERGFNQSAEIARIVSRHLKIPLDTRNVRRIRATPPQAELPLKERHKNVRGAFECQQDLTGQRILLLDDVMTSGATLDECARVLKLHGAVQITVVVAARALKH